MAPTIQAATPTWRTRDIVVAAVIGVAFGVFFFAFGAAWRVFDGAGPLQNLLYGAWLLPALVAPLIIRKPGAALFTEMVAAGVSALLGSQWGPDVLLSGFVQGSAAEIVFAMTLYRTWSFPVLAVAGLASSAAAWLHDWQVWYQAYAMDTLLAIGLFMAISGAILLPLAALALVRALRQTGVLDGFPS